MPTTAAGAVYTARSFTTSDGQPAVWYMDDAKRSRQQIPTVIYAHGNEGPYNQFLTMGAWAGLRNWLMDNGYAVVESHGGGGSSWGNDAARRAYLDAFEHVSGQINTGPVIVLGRSMGGLVAYWLAARSPIAARVVGLIINSGTTDLAYRVTFNAPAGNKDIIAAFGAKTLSEFYEVAPEYDPMQWPGLLWSGKHVLQLWGDADETVPPARNGAAWVAKYGADALTLTTDIRAGGDHSTGNGSYLQVDAMTRYLRRITAGNPALRIRDRFAVGADGVLLRAN